MNGRSSSRWEIADYPEIEERIGENPARFLDARDPDGFGLDGDGDAPELALAFARIDGIRSVEVCRAWLEVEVDLHDEPRSSVIAALNERKAELEAQTQSDGSDAGDETAGAREASA